MSDVYKMNAASNMFAAAVRSVGGLTDEEIARVMMVTFPRAMRLAFEEHDEFVRKEEDGKNKIDTLTFDGYYPSELVFNDNGDRLKEVVIKDIAEDLAISLGKYVNFYTEFCSRMNKYRFFGEIKVVDISSFKKQGAD